MSVSLLLCEEPVVELHYLDNEIAQQVPFVIKCLSFLKALFSLDTWINFVKFIKKKLSKWFTNFSSYQICIFMLKVISFLIGVVPFILYAVSEKFRVWFDGIL